VIYNSARHNVLDTKKGTREQLDAKEELRKRKRERERERECIWTLSLPLAR
jgi:hypothetical protein